MDLKNKYIGCIGSERDTKSLISFFHRYGSEDIAALTRKEFMSLFQYALNVNYALIAKTITDTYRNRKIE